MDSIDSLVEAIDAFDGGVVIVTHSELILNNIATRLIVFDGGKVELFEGTYQEFLDRVGWANEREAEASRPSSRQNKLVPTIFKRGNFNKKEMRRLRAQLNEDRSKTLVPLQTKIAELEKTIMLLEKDVERESQALVEASEKGDGEAISKLSITIHNLNAKIETLFKELESLTAEHDAKAKELEERLNGLQQDVG
jgi:ATP-binding cassette subfamily F protein 3